MIIERRVFDGAEGSGDEYTDHETAEAAKKRQEQYELERRKVRNRRIRRWFISQAFGLLITDYVAGVRYGGYSALAARVGTVLVPGDEASRVGADHSVAFDGFGNGISHFL